MKNFSTASLILLSALALLGAGLGVDAAWARPRRRLDTAPWYPQAPFHPSLALPGVDMENVDPVDLCLLACSMCYQKEELLLCANQACLGSLLHFTQRKREVAQNDESLSHECPGLTRFSRR